jgi:hypothetical protein
MFSLTIIVLTFGRYHIITGGEMKPLPDVVPRKEFGFGTPYINLEKMRSGILTGARWNDPLAIKVLQQHRYILTDKEIQDTLKAEYRTAYQDFMNSMDDSAEYQELILDGIREKIDSFERNLLNELERLSD